MGNLFLGFPVARAKIADMISTSAPPISHHAQHENGGTDEIDATGLTGAGGGGGLAFDTSQFTTMFESLSGWNQLTTGSATFTLGGDGITIDTGTTINSVAQLDKQSYVSTTLAAWSKDRQFEAHAYIVSGTNATGRFYITTGSKDTARHIGFDILDGVLRGSLGNGTAQQVVNLQTLGAGAFSVTRSLKCVYTAGVKAEYYVDGVLLGTISTGLPTGTTSSQQLFLLYLKNAGTATDKYMIVSNLVLGIKP